MTRLLWKRAAAAIAAGVLALPLSALPLSAADKVASEKLLPPIVYGYVSVPDVAVLKQRVDASALGEMLRDPDLQETRDQFKELISKAGEKAQEELGVGLRDLLEIPSGEVAFAVVQTGGTGEVGYVLILDYGDSGPTVDRLVEKAEAGLEERGGKRSVERIEGTEVVVYTIPKKAAEGDDLETDQQPAGEQTDTVAMFRKDERLVLGGNVAVIEAVLARWDGRHGSTFAGDEVYTYIADKTKTDGREPVLVWYVNPISAIQTGVAGAQNAPPQAQMALAFLPTLGVTKLKAVGGSLDFATQEFDSVGKVYLYVDQPATGVLGVLRFPAADLAPPAWISDAATGYFGLNWDLAGAYDAVRSLFDQFQGPGAFDRIVDQVANKPDGPKIHPKRDVIDQLSGKVHVATYPPPESAATEEADTTQQAPSVFALGVKDEQKMKDLLGRLAQTPGFPGKTREFQGVTVYDMPTAATGGGAQGTASVAVAKGSLLIATEAKYLEQAIRGGGQPLSGTPGFRKVDAKIPDQVSMLVYQDQRSQLQTAYEALRSGRGGQQIEGFDFSTLPPFGDIERYLLTSGTYAVPDENGALVVSFSLKLEEDRR